MKRFIKLARAWLADNWRLWLVILAGVGAVSALLLFKLGSLVHGLSVTEFDIQQTLANNGLSLSKIAHNPLFLPYALAMYVMQLTPFSGPTAVRLTGALFGLLGAIGFFYILKKWYTLRMAVFGTALFATSSWFLHTSRYASPEVSYLLLPLLIAGVVHIQAKARSRLVLALVVLLGLLTLYIPGLIWFLLAALILERQVILKSLRLQPIWFLALLGVMTAVLITPLVLMIVWPLASGDVANNILALLGLPAQMPSPAEFVRNAGHLVSNIFVYNNQGSLFVAGHLPLLDACTAALALIGMYQFVVHFKLARTKLIAWVGIAGALLIATGGPVSIVLLLPFLYLLAVEAIKWLLDMWLRVFPRNPLARSFGIALVVILILATSFYHLNRYYLAWGHSPETRAVFNKVP